MDQRENGKITSQAPVKDTSGRHYECMGGKECQWAGRMGSGRGNGLAKIKCSFANLGLAVVALGVELKTFCGR